MLVLVNDRWTLGPHANGRTLSILGIAGVGLVIILDIALLGSSILNAVGIRLGRGRVARPTPRVRHQGHPGPQHSGVAFGGVCLRIASAERPGSRPDCVS